MTISEFTNLNQTNDNSRYSFSVLYTAIAAVSAALTIFYLISSILTGGSLSVQVVMSTFDTVVASTAAGTSWAQYYDLNQGLDSFSNFIGGLGLADNVAISPYIEKISQIFEKIYNEIFDGTLIIISLPKLSLSVASGVLDVMSAVITADDLILTNLEKNSLNQ